MKKRRQSKKKRSQASLFHAAEEGILELVAELIKEGADVNEKNQFGKTPLDWARNEEVKAALREHGDKHS